MSGIKYYILSDEEDCPDEFCAIRNDGGEPADYYWYVPEKECVKLRELVRDAWGSGHPDKSCGDCEIRDECHAEIEEAHKRGRGRWNTRCLFERRIEGRMRELGIEVDG